MEIKINKEAIEKEINKDLEWCKENPTGSSAMAIFEGNGIQVQVIIEQDPDQFYEDVVPGLAEAS